MSDRRTQLLREIESDRSRIRRTMSELNLCLTADEWEKVPAHIQVLSDLAENMTIAKIELMDYPWEQSQ